MSELAKKERAVRMARQHLLTAQREYLAVVTGPVGSVLPSCVDCGQPATHGEYFHGTKRFWCEAHTPWSGHFEHCGGACEDLVCAERVPA
jgi:hypothetical protein